MMSRKSLLLLAMAMILVNGLPKPQDESSSIIFFDDEEGAEEEVSLADKIKQYLQERKQEAEQDSGQDSDTEVQDPPTETRRIAINDELPLPDSTPPPGLFEECTSDDRLALPGRNPTTGEWDCFNIATLGPCPEDSQWFVADSERQAAGDPVGVCVERKCPEFGKVWYRGECQETERTGVCMTGMELLINPFGEGECSCISGFIPYNNEQGFPVCHQENLQGPCQDGFQITDVSQSDPSLAENDFGTACIKSPCPENQIYWHPLAKCITPLECGEDEKVSFNPMKDHTECQIIVRQLLTLPTNCPQGHSLDHEGNCVQVVRFGSGLSRPPRRLATRNQNIRSFLSLRFGTSGKK
jgi:hypothetical protein